MTARSPIRVMIVDDNADLRLLLRMALERTGLFVVVAQAADGHDAIAVAPAARPDIVLLDVAMPIMDGVQALPELLRVVPDAKVIVLSGFEARYLAPVLIDAGAVAYLEKGVAVESLVDQMLAVIQQVVSA